MDDHSAQSTAGEDLRECAQERDRLAQLLIDAEQRAAALPDLRLRIADLEYELSESRRSEAAARQEAMELDRMLMYGRRALRYGRPLIELLRRARRRLHG